MVTPGSAHSPPSLEIQTAGAVRRRRLTSAAACLMEIRMTRVLRISRICIITC
jgi:hypothetical protein